MDNFLVSARKYRPATFGSVIAQEPVTETLRNAIKSHQIAHAYLFCGPRGVGKTTCARIFAKTINCSSLSSDTEACQECESCRAFNEQRSYNIHELDAASNNGIEEMRSLIEQVRIPPQIGKYSVYIIDEVHMLSTAAFNAFLKTLEEPPAHAIFIMATTERHKILPTILSRCQVFDFQRINTSDISRNLEKIAITEHINYDIDGLHVIAQKSDGAMRDALSIFDQIVSFSNGNVVYEQVIKSLNVLDYDYYFRITDSILEGNYPNALLIFDEILKKGFDGHSFLTGLASHFRDLLVCSDTITISLLDVGDNIQNKYKQQTSVCPIPFLLRALEICNQCDVGYRTSKNQRLHVELALLKLCMLQGQKKNDLEPSSIALTPSARQLKTTSIASSSSAEQVKIVSIASTPSTEKSKTNSVESKQNLVVHDFNKPEQVVSQTATANTTSTTKSSPSKISIKSALKTANEIAKQTIDIKDTPKESIATPIQEEPKVEDVPSTNDAIDPTLNKYYTPEEKLSYMARKNPKLGEFCKTFELNIN